MKEIFVYNNLTKKKEKLEPLDTPQLNIYTCGPTVYDHSHIGHARSSLTWDIIVRYLRYAGYKVSWSRNITDIDDKIIKKSIDLKISPDKVARIYTHSFHEDMIALGIEWPDFEPQATQYLGEMYNFIQGLIDKNHAYSVDNDVYFSVSSFDEYGKLKGQNIEELEKGFGRIEENDKKKHQLDFALWKGCKSEDEYGFNSPWGKGRPGWHLECSTMNYSIFKEQIDIHGGGDDLIFPHHENEIAQSEAYTGKQFAKYWMHNGMIMVNSKKMSKSEGNFITIKESLKKTTGNALRLFVLNTHYRMPLNYTEEAIIAAQNGVNRLKEALSDYSPKEPKNGKADNEHLNNFDEAMSDDFNGPKALAVLFNLADKINIAKKDDEKLSLQSTLHHISSVLGLELLSSDSTSLNIKEESVNNLIDDLLSWRTACKEEKDFKNADKIRDTLTSCNIEVKDLPGNSFKWQFKV